MTTTVPRTFHPPRRTLCPLNTRPFPSPPCPPPLLSVDLSRGLSLWVWLIRSAQRPHVRPPPPPGAGGRAPSSEGGEVGVRIRRPGHPGCPEVGGGCEFSSRGNAAGGVVSRDLGTCCHFLWGEPGGDIAGSRKPHFKWWREGPPLAPAARGAPVPPCPSARAAALRRPAAGGGGVEVGGRGEGGPSCRTRLAWMLRSRRWRPGPRRPIRLPSLPGSLTAAPGEPLSLAPAPSEARGPCSSACP